MAGCRSRVIVAKSKTVGRAKGIVSCISCSPAREEHLVGERSNRSIGAKREMMSHHNPTQCLDQS